MQEIYLVTIKQTGEQTAFGSLAAIYDTFTDKEIGVKLYKLWDKGVCRGKVYENNICIIKQLGFKRKSQKRRYANRRYGT